MNIIFRIRFKTYYSGVYGYNWQLNETT